MTVAAGYLPTPTLGDMNKRLVEKMDSWSRLDSCPVCGSASIGKLATVRHLSYSRCKNCGFAFCNPVPSDEVLHAYYNSDFYSNYRRLEENRMRRDRYFSVSMYTTMQRLAGWLGEDKALSILDYGCGPGSFMAFLREQSGFVNVEGIEINRESVMIGKRNFGLTIATSKEELQRQSYDCVLLLEVIEHLSRPDLHLEEIAKLTKPGGSLLITTPAVDSVVGRLMPSHCPHYTAPGHVSLFTTKAMKLLLNRFGFSVERMELDHAYAVMETVAASIFYDLDFMSPQNDDDANDGLYTPNALGRLVGCKPSRGGFGSIGPLHRPVKLVDRLFGRFASHVPSVPRNNHLYVLARKDR